MKKILVVGKGSYIGVSFENHIKDGDYEVSVLDTLGNDKDNFDFSGYDSIFFVAGIVHRKKNSIPSELYYKVNRDLTYEIASKAKASGVPHFVYLSSMSVYGDASGAITVKTPVSPANDYGKSKYEAELKLGELCDDAFRVCILRPPMVYGRGCPGNYNTLSNFVKKMPFFPDYTNKRSMIYVGNLCEFVKRAIDQGLFGVYFPQNSQYICTSKMASEILKCNGKKPRLTKIFNPFLKLFEKMGLEIVQKCFGSLWYEASDDAELVDEFSFEQSIELTEK